MNLKSLIKFTKLKNKHEFNDNLAKIILHLGEGKVNSFAAMKELGVIPSKTKCFSDLAVNIKDFIYTWRAGCHLTTIRHNAKLTTHGKKIYRIINKIE